jgi:LacI family transcriptional regulator
MSKLSQSETELISRPMRVTAPSPIRRVALLIETSGSYGRGLLRGVAKYNRAHGDWSTYFHPHGLDAAPPAWLFGWRGDGILARVRTDATAKALAQNDIPIVTLGRPVSANDFANVRSDPAEAGRAGAEHLLGRCLRHYAFCGRKPGEHIPQDEIGASFHRVITKAGWSCAMYAAAEVNPGDSWDVQQEKLAEWIRGLPKPVGIMGCNDERGLQVLDACRRLGALVPDEVAVIGADNDEHLCDLSIPPLTSVDINAEKIGYTAASMLDQLMQGRKLAQKMQLIPPRGIVNRLSTDTVASDDEEVNRAIRYIREQACNGLRVTGVLAYMGISRASLQHRMKKIAGRTIHREIEHVRLMRVKELLLSRDMTIKQAARAAGFSSVQYMTRVFRLAVGQTPARYRGFNSR